MTTYFTLLTTAGQAKITNALATGTTVQVTQIAVGDGNGNPVTPTEARTALVREVHRGPVSSLQVDGSNPNWLVAELVIPMATGGWTIREIGMFDVDGTLIAYGNFPDSYKPVLPEGSGKEIIVRMYLEVSSTAAVQLVIDPTVVLASRAWVLSQLTAANIIPGGTTGQVLKKQSNASGDVAWSDPTAADINVGARSEQQTAAASQTIFTLAVLNTTGLAVYVEGVRVFNFATLDTVRIQLPTGLPAGTIVNFVQNDPAMPYLNAAFRPKLFFMNQI
jgi:phage-related tail fiber protein